MAKLSVTSFNSLNVLFMYFKAIKHIHIYTCTIFLMNCSFYHYEMFLIFIHGNNLCIEVCFTWYLYSHSSLMLICLFYFFPSFNLKLIPALARVMISQFVSLSPTSGSPPSSLSAWSRFQTLCPPLSIPPPLVLSQKQIS